MYSLIKTKLLFIIKYIDKTTKLLPTKKGVITVFLK